MAITPSTVFKASPGSSRIYDVHWPQLGVQRILGTFPATTATTRGGVAITSATQVVTGGTGTQTLAVSQGQAMCQLTVAAAPDVSGWSWASPIGSIYPLLDIVGGVPPFGFPQLVYRAICVIAYPAFGGAIPAGADVGMGMYAVNATSLGGTRAGVLFAPRDNATMGLGVRRVNGGAYTVDRTLTLAQAGITDLTKPNVYELRISSATNSAAAQLKAFVNNVQFGNAIDCGTPAALFPAIDVGGGGFTGFHFGICLNAIGFAYTLSFSSCHLMVASAEDDSM